MPKTIATMTIDGLDTVKSTMMTKVFEWYQVAQKSQSSIYDVKSLDYTLSQYKPGPGLSEAIKRDLEYIYQDIFKNVEVLVNTSTSDKDGVVKISLNVIANEDNIEYSLARELLVKDTKLITYNTILKDKLNYNSEG